MDSTKLKQFLLLREFEQQQITINHDKLQTLDSERKPNIIFESDGFKSIERRGSSTASSDSGFPISPSTPPCVNSKTPKSGTRVLPNNDPSDRSDDELDIPPLPASRPPEDLERPFSPEALVTLHSDKKNHKFLLHLKIAENSMNHRLILVVHQPVKVRMSRILAIIT